MKSAAYASFVSAGSIPQEWDDEPQTERLIECWLCGQKAAVDYWYNPPQSWKVSDYEPDSRGRCYGYCPECEQHIRALGLAKSRECE